jgi:alginate O-acetyltransferase complex protein AlgI
MLFNSPVFIFLFLPLTAGLFYVLANRSLARALALLIVASLLFYGWWRPLNVLLIAPSIAINYLIAQALIARGEEQTRTSTLLFWFGIAFNICFLAYFKYTNFLATLSNDVTGTHFAMQKIILPLGVSFITFQKIALLIDARAGRVARVGLRDYVLFVLFFPPLISGPIVHFRELMPQFAKLDGKLHWEDISVGGTLFFFGLAKKMLIADPIAIHIDPIWNAAAAGRPPTLIEAWAGALGYMVQLYFDFSGYSDMAIGLARLFGIKLPHNFNSPLRAMSVIDYWARWHVTLTRFLTAYLYSPMALALTRARLARGKQAMAGRKTRRTTFAALVAFPTITTMFVSGVWHGAGYQFVVFGVLHGLALVVNHAWRTWKPKPVKGQPEPRWWPFLAWLLAIGFVVLVEVFFRADSVPTALRMFEGMFGGQGIAVPQALRHLAAPMLAPIGVTVGSSGQGALDFLQMIAWILAAWAIALAMPNTHEMLVEHEPALDFQPVANRRKIELRWAPTRGWAFIVAVIALLSLMSFGQVSAFLYWQF